MYRIEQNVSFCQATLSRFVLLTSLSMQAARRLEDRVRELAARIAAAADHELAYLTLQLQVALTEYNRRLQNKTSATILTWPDFPRERRSA